MAVVKMMQGDSYPVLVELEMKETEDPITPKMVSNVEISVGEELRKTSESGGVFYDEDLKQWYFIPSQQETLAMEPDIYEVQARVKFKNGQYSAVKGVKVGSILIEDASSEEVI